MEYVIWEMRLKIHMLCSHAKVFSIEGNSKYLRKKEMGNSSELVLSKKMEEVLFFFYNKETSVIILSIN